MGSVPGRWGPAVWVFSTSGFHCSLATKPVSSETSKAEPRSNGDHSSIGDSWPIAFSGYPRGPRVGVRLGARGTQRLTNQLRLALEPECLENPTATAREDPQDGADWSETLKLFVVSDIGRRSTLLSSIPSKRSWQFCVPASDEPFLASCLWLAKPHRTPGTDRACWKPRWPPP